MLNIIQWRISASNNPQTTAIWPLTSAEIVPLEGAVAAQNERNREGLSEFIMKWSEKMALPAMSW